MKQRKKTEILQTSKLLALRLRAAVTVYLLGEIIMGQACVQFMINSMK